MYNLQLLESSQTVSVEVWKLCASNKWRRSFSCYATLSLIFSENSACEIDCRFPIHEENINGCAYVYCPGLENRLELCVLVPRQLLFFLGQDAKANKLQSISVGQFIFYSSFFSFFSRRMILINLSYVGSAVSQLFGSVKHKHHEIMWLLSSLEV